MARPSTTTMPASASSTTTITLETSSSSSSNQQHPQIKESLVLKLKPIKKNVSWKEGTVDNELMNKKSSKKCCIFHKDKPFDEDGSDDDHDHDHADKGGDHEHGHEGDDACCAEH